MNRRMSQEQCALCGRPAQVLKSHIIPKFTIEWLKASSATGYLRAAHKPNLRIQDGRKVRLLCAVCEARFSKWEKRFAEQVFIPFQEKRQDVFPCEDWLLQFTVSLAWRTAVNEIPRYRSSHPNLAPFVDEALMCWRAFLLGQREYPGPYEHHVFFLDFIAESSGNMPAKLEEYLLRAVDTTLPSSSTKVFAYTKLPGIIFWSAIHPPKPAGQYENSLVSKDGTIQARQRIVDADFPNFLIHRVKTAMEQMAGISPKQLEKMEQSAMMDPARALNSQDFALFVWQTLREKRKRRR